MASRRSRKSAPADVPVGSYVVEGRLFRSRAEALIYCAAQRISAYRIGLSPVVVPEGAAELGEARSVSVLFETAHSHPVLVLDRLGKDPVSFPVRLPELADLAAAVKARLRELSRTEVSS